MAEPNTAQLINEQVENATSQNPDPAIARHMLAGRVDWRNINQQMQAAQFAKESGVYTVGSVTNTTPSTSTDIYVFGAVASLALLAWLL